MKLKQTIAAATVAGSFALSAHGATTSATPPVDSNTKLGIANLISLVRAELVEAEKQMEARGDETLFYTEGLELEISFVVKESTVKKGAVDLQVVTFGADRDYSNEMIQKIRLQLTTRIPLPNMGPNAALYQNKELIRQFVADMVPGMQSMEWSKEVFELLQGEENKKTFQDILGNYEIYKQRNTFFGAD